MSAAVGRGDAEQVDEDGDDSNVFQRDSPEKEQVDFIVGHAEGGSHHDGDNRGRGSAHEPLLSLEIGEEVVREQVEQSAGNAAPQVEPHHLLLAEGGEEYLPEPVEPQHVEEDVPHVVVYEHVGEQSPRMGDKLVGIGGHLDVGEHNREVDVEQQEYNPRDA